MAVAAPPKPPRPDELEALIREARARQRKRRLGTAAVVALLAGSAIVLYAVLGGGNPSTLRGGAGPRGAVKSGGACGVRGAGVRILDASGQTVYREPAQARPYIRPEIRCSGATIWAVWDNGVAASQEGYVGARSGDGGRRWRLIFAERFFGVKAPHQLDSYMAVWTLHGPRAAYFTGMCPACGFGTVSLWVTKNGGRTFRRYDVPALTGLEPTGLRVSGDDVTIRARRKTVTIRIA